MGVVYSVVLLIPLVLAFVVPSGSMLVCASDRDHRSVRVGTNGPERGGHVTRISSSSTSTSIPKGSRRPSSRPVRRRRSGTSTTSARRTLQPLAAVSTRRGCPSARATIRPRRWNTRGDRHLCRSRSCACQVGAWIAAGLASTNDRGLDARAAKDSPDQASPVPAQWNPSPTRSSCAPCG